MRNRVSTTQGSRGFTTFAKGVTFHSAKCVIINYHKGQFCLYIFNYAWLMSYKCKTPEMGKIPLSDTNTYE